MNRREIPLLLVGVFIFIGSLNSANLFEGPPLSQQFVIHTSSQDSLKNMPLVDHHTHIFTPTVSKHLVNTITGLDELPPLGLNQLTKNLQKNSTKKAAVLSNAYFFSEAGASTEEDFRTMQSQNDKIAKAVSQHPNKLVGFFGINPLSDSASVEIKRNADKEEFSGIKLHLANSKVDLQNASHLKQLARIFHQANNHNLGIIIHLRTTKNDFGQKDAENFIQEVLSQAPDIPIQIAHMAGWGGYDPVTDAVLGTFARYITHNEIGENIYFDISAVIRAPRKKAKADSPEWYPKNRYKQLVKQMRKIGMEHILFGTDWPEWQPRDYQNKIIKQLPLNNDELRTLFTNHAPWF
ncbi:amidohydrolase family protein [Fodinibius saliphilus]|uniref:amidohydrolase family protein n=1 Tax=Fodinibius saliphilus TaxID=1920650 RepID=UPI001108C46B|nr:amidohydrolase family protein [Fodinibius saliphilus]